MGKVPFKFKFDLIIETVEKIAATGDLVVVWERGSRADATEPAKVDKATRKATFGNQKITAEITMFKNQPSERKFLDKVFKIAVKTDSVDGKTVAKIHLNFASYAEVPSGKKRVSAELSNGATLIASIVSSFIGMGKALPKGQDPEDEDNDADNGREGDAGGGGEDAPSNFMKKRLGATMTRAASMRTIGRRGQKDPEPGGGGGGGGSDKTDNVEKLRKENARLKKQVDDLERQGAYAGQGGGGRTSDEAKALRQEVQELKNALGREPVYSDVVKELKEAKMALALLHLEKEECTLELMKYQRGDIVSPRSVNR